MLFGIYLGTTIYAWRTLFRYIRDFKEKLDEEGYEIIKKKHTIYEYIGSAIIVSLPVVNLVFPFYFGDVNRTYNEIKVKMINDGLICLKESELNHKEETTTSRDEIMEEVVRLREEVQALRNEKSIQNRIVTTGTNVETLKQKVHNLQKLSHAVYNKEGAFGYLLSDKERNNILRLISKTINDITERIQVDVKNTDKNDDYEKRLYPLMNQKYDSNNQSFDTQRSKTYHK